VTLQNTKQVCDFAVQVIHDFKTRSPLTAQKYTPHAHEWLNIGLVWDRIDHFDDLLVESFLAPKPCSHRRSRRNFSHCHGCVFQNREAALSRESGGIFCQGCRRS
jgi:hypothetical protein